MGGASYIDEKYRASYTKDQDFLKGDFQGHVLAVDADFDDSATGSESAGDIADEDSQYEVFKYPGRMRILGNLVWSELYPMLMLQSVVLQNFWLQAGAHPSKVYTGPTVPSQVEPWKKRHLLKTLMMNSFVDFLEEKNPTLAGKVKGMRKDGVI